MTLYDNDCVGRDDEYLLAPGRAVCLPHRPALPFPVSADDEPLSLHMLDRRLRLIEGRNQLADAEHQALKATDGQTAAAVKELADTINNPRTGLIVELERFREEVRTDRRVFKAWVGGAVFIVSVVYSIVTLFAPVIQKALGLP